MCGAVLGQHVGRVRARRSRAPARRTMAPGGGSGKPRSSPRSRSSRSRFSRQRQPPSVPSPSRTRLCSRKLRTIRLGTAARRACVGVVAGRQRRRGPSPASRRCRRANGDASSSGSSVRPPWTRVLDRRDVDDDQRAQQLRAAQRQLHRDLAAHRVPDERDRLAELLELGGDQLGHVDVVDAVGPRRVPVVGQVEQGHPVAVGQALGDRRPVLALAEQPVDEHHARAGLARRVRDGQAFVAPRPSSVTRRFHQTFRRCRRLPCRGTRGRPMPGRRRRSTSTTSRSDDDPHPRGRRAPRPADARSRRPSCPPPGPGERVWVLAVPFRAPGAGRGLARRPAGARLGRRGAARRSWRPTTRRRTRFERFLEDELNEKPRPLPMARPMTPRDQQWDGADAVAAHAAAGGRVFLLGDDPGVGKTGTAILAARLIAEQRDVRTRARRRRPAGRDHDPALGPLDRRVRRRRAALVRDHLGPAGEGVEAAGSTSSSPTRRTWSGTRRRSGGSTGRRSRAPAGSRTRRSSWPRPRRPAHTPLELPYLAPQFAVRHGEPMREWADLPEEARRARVPRGTGPLRLAVDRGRRRAPRRPRPAAGLAGRRRPAGDAAPPRAVGAGVGHRHAGGAHAGGAGRLRVRVVGVPRRDAAGPARRGRARRAGPRCCGSGRRPG